MYKILIHYTLFIFTKKSMTYQLIISRAVALIILSILYKDCETLRVCTKRNLPAKCKFSTLFMAWHGFKWVLLAKPYLNIPNAFSERFSTKHDLNFIRNRPTKKFAVCCFIIWLSKLLHRDRLRAEANLLFFLICTAAQIVMHKFAIFSVIQ